MGSDTFETLARHYDSMMSHIEYERWVAVSTMIAELCPDEDFEHLDVGCGTGALVRLLREYGWRSYGADLSKAMLATHGTSDDAPLLRADMRNLPFKNRFHFVTCVFDSLNFLLDPKDFKQALQSMRQSMTDDGIVYFDVITETMVLEHYADRDWVDRNGKSKMRWHGEYDIDKRIISNTIWVDKGEPTVVRERVYTIDEIREAAEEAGLNILGIVDTETWCAPTDATLRLDIVASVRDAEALDQSFQHIQQDIQILLDDAD
jgi:SAM-dependent methyltransferase